MSTKWKGLSVLVKLNETVFVFSLDLAYIICNVRVAIPNKALEKQESFVIAGKRGEIPLLRLTIKNLRISDVKEIYGGYTGIKYLITHANKTHSR